MKNFINTPWFYVVGIFISLVLHLAFFWLLGK